MCLFRPASTGMLLKSDCCSSNVATLQGAEKFEQLLQAIFSKKKRK